ncbi:MAG: hypothetical protein HYY01_14255 [Chloroflexi bacterium]|nr:hypothetical protein [Chloroflexota bacterium]
MRWPDASLGCPQPGVAYAQVATPGYRIILTSGGKEHHYHSDERGPPFFCANPAPTLTSTPTPTPTLAPTPLLSEVASCPGLELEGRIILQALLPQQLTAPGVYVIVQSQCSDNQVSVSFAFAAGHFRSVSIKRYATEQEAQSALGTPNITFRGSPAARTTVTGYPGPDSLKESLAWQMSRWLFTTSSFDDTAYCVGPGVSQLSDDLHNAAVAVGLFG